MAEIITIPDLENGKVDIDTLADIVNLQETTTETRLSGPVKTWFGLQSDLSSATGLTYNTKAEMDAAPGVKVGQAARVTDDGVNDGFYIWNGTAWERTVDPLSASLFGANSARLTSGEQYSTLRSLGLAGGGGVLIGSGEKILGFRIPVGQTGAGTYIYPHPVLSDISNMVGKTIQIRVRAAVDPGFETETGLRQNRAIAVKNGGLWRFADSGNPNIPVGKLIEETYTDGFVLRVLEYTIVSGDEEVGALLSVEPTASVATTEHTFNIDSMVWTLAETEDTHTGSDYMLERYIGGLEDQIDAGRITSGDQFDTMQGIGTGQNGGTVNGTANRIFNITIPAGQTGRQTFINVFFTDMNLVSLMGSTVRMTFETNVDSGFQAEAGLRSNRVASIRRPAGWVYGQGGAGQPDPWGVLVSETYSGNKLIRVIDLEINETLLNVGAILSVNTDALVATSTHTLDFVAASWYVVSSSSGSTPSVLTDADKILDARFGSSASTGVNYRVHPSDGSIVKSEADLDNWATWGSSSSWYMAPLIDPILASEYGANIYNGGVSGQGVDTISARLGSRPANLVFPGNTIPASGTVNVTIPNADIYRLTNYYGEIAGVKGRLVKPSAQEDPATFTRTTAGAAVTLDGTELFIPDDGLAHRDGMTLLWMGKNDTDASGDTAAIVAKVVEYTNEAFDYLAPYNIRALVLGHFVNSNIAVPNAAQDQIIQINAAYAKRYGDLFIDVQGWLMSAQVWVDMGITPTAQDNADQAAGVIPTSLRRDFGHLTDAAYIGVFNYLIKPRIENVLRWF